MVKLFICDIDGCLAEPFEPFDLPAWQQLVAIVARGEQEEGVPRIGLCSGRAYAYVEAVTQALGIHAPVLFESGAGLFHRPSVEVVWNPNLTAEVEAQLEAVRHWMFREIFPHRPGVRFDYGKRGQTGLIGKEWEEVQPIVPLAEAFVADHFPNAMRVFHTHVSIDVVPAMITKRRAIEWLVRRENLLLEEVAYIGDTNGDIEALQTVGRSFAPANATDEVKSIVQHVTRGSHIEGVLEAISLCMEENAVVFRGA